MTREEWLCNAVEKLRPLFAKHKLTIPGTLRVSCGWPVRGGASKTRRVVGQCWNAEAAKDNVVQIFISPWLATVEDVLGTLVHELIHACLPEAKHGPDFKSAAKDLGLVGKPTHTTVGEELKKLLLVIAETLGDYDHGHLDPHAVTADGPKKQTNRQLKIVCGAKDKHDSGVGYILRGSKSTLELGIPDCPLCGEPLTKEEKEGEETEHDGD